MKVPCYSFFALTFCPLALLIAPSFIVATTITTAPQPTSYSLPATCEFRTINYITDALPRQCGKASWSGKNATASVRSAAESAVPTVEQETPSATESIPPEQNTSTDTIQSQTPTVVTATPTATEDAGELNEDSFLSFEEWKEQTLKKAGQNNPNIGNKRSGEKKRSSESTASNLESLGEEGEIDLDFAAFKGPAKGETILEATQKDQDDAQTSLEKATKRKDQYRSKDAGKTCKERFSYASFDAGATVLKTHSGAKNSKAILVETKDSYMLSECSTPNKFLIIELSEDIMIDTVVLASYEFFSSMIRTFRVSVSDKYPVKIDKWIDLGTYEARNSREIQAFLIENPQIWARYLRIEFLTHYGNEFYCPLSLVRVHGSRMLESWKESEAIGEEDENDEIEESPEERLIPDAVADKVKEEERLRLELKEANVVIEELASTTEELAKALKAKISQHNLDSQPPTLPGFTPWVKPHIAETLQMKEQVEELAFCPLSESPVTRPAIHTTVNTTNSTTELVGAIVPTNSPSATATLSPSSPISNSSITSSSKDAPQVTHVSKSTTSANISKTPEPRDSTASTTSSATSKAQSMNPSQKSKVTATGSAPSALPTVQESFFKAVSRRLQLLESNSTLSLKYIEEQSRTLREAFSRVEKKQLQKTTTFLDTLNSTVLAELREFRKQYDEIWQSTVISLEGQKEESRREILAISSRLNILADEVVFQKRMSIVQSVLLLVCLGLVIFSRVSGGQHDFGILHTSRVREGEYPLSPLEESPESPDYQGLSPVTDPEDWLEESDEKSLSDGSPDAHARNRDYCPPLTPISAYSKSDTCLTPPSGSEEHFVNDFVDDPARHSTPPSQDRTSSQRHTASLSKPTKLRQVYLCEPASPPPGDIDSSREVSDGQDQGNADSWQRTELTQDSRHSSSLLSPLPEVDRADLPGSKPLPALPPDRG